MKQFSDSFFNIKGSRYNNLKNTDFQDKKTGNHIFLQNTTLTTDINTLKSQTSDI